MGFNPAAKFDMPPEFVINGGMELDSNWYGFGWATSVRSNEQAYAGTYSRKVSITGADYAGIVGDAISSLVVGETYKVSCRVRGLDLVSGNFVLRFNGDFAPVPVSNGTWVLLEGYRIWAGPANIPCVYIDSYTNNGKYFYVDDFSIQDIMDNLIVGFDYGLFDGINKLILSDGIKFADTQSHIWNIQRTFTDGIKFADTKVIQIGKLLSDGIKFADTKSQVWAIYLALSDGIKFAENRSVNFSKALSDGIKFAITIGSDVFIWWVKKGLSSLWNKTSPLTSGWSKRSVDGDNWTKGSGQGPGWTKKSKAQSSYSEGTKKVIEEIDP